MSHIPRAIFREDGNQVGVTLLRHTVNGWQVMLLPACAAKCEVKSRVPDQWKESFVGSADWCIPVGPEHLLLWRESFDSGVIIGTVSLPNIFKQLSVLRGISEVERRTVPLMAITHAVFLWEAISSSNTSCTVETVTPLSLPTCLPDGSDVEPITAKIRLLFKCSSLIMTAGVLHSRFLCFEKGNCNLFGPEKRKNGNVLALSKNTVEKYLKMNV